MDFPEEAGAMLSLHYLEAGEYRARMAIRDGGRERAEDVYAYVEAAGLYARALEAGAKLPDLPKLEIGRMQEALGDAWYKAGEYRKALDAYTAAQGLVAGERLLEADLLLKLSRVEEKLGQYPEALRWVERAREALEGVRGTAKPPGRTQRASVWYATVLQAQGQHGRRAQVGRAGSARSRGSRRSRSRRRCVHGNGVGATACSARKAASR